MTSLLEKLDVDPVQWRALVRASLRIDFSTITAKHTAKQTEKEARKKTAGILVAIFVYCLGGITPAAVIGISKDLLLGGAFLTTVVAFMVTATLLMGEGNSIISPSDHQILGFRPVTSRTYLAVRVTSLLLRTIVISLCIAIGPVVVVLVKYGLRPGLALGVIVAALTTGLAITLAVVAMYGWMLRVAGPQRMLRYTAYMQFFAGMITWGGFMLVNQDMARRALTGLAISGNAWWLFYPGTWFASWVPLADGQLTWPIVTGIVLSLLLIVVLAQFISDKLSLSYSDDLSQLAAATSTKTGRPKTRWMGGLTAETRAIAILVRSQLEHDMKFRLGLISLLPITVMYMSMGGWPSDPFVPERRQPGQGGMIQMALMFIPMTLRQVIVSSDSYRASWIYHTTPSDRGSLVLSARNIITAFFLVPYLACLSAVFAYSYGNSTHALVHTAFVGMLSYLVLQFSIMVDPQLPFSREHGKDTNFAMAFWRMLGGFFIGLGLYALLTLLIYRSKPAMVATAVALVAIAYGMDRLTRWRVRKRPIEAIYIG